MTYLRPALVMLILLTLITGIAYPLLTTGLRAAAVSGCGQRFAAVPGRQGGRLRADRPELHARRLFLGPPIGHRRFGL